MVVDFNLPNPLFSQCFRAIANHEAALTPAEKALLQGAIPKRVGEFSTGRGCAKAALRALGAEDCELLRGSQKEPRWPVGFVGSISHSPALAGAVAARQSDLQAIGLDIECLGRVVPAMWDLVFTSSEQQYLHEQPAATQPFLTTLFFSMKESFYKLQFPLTNHPLWFTDVELHVQGAGFKLLLLKELPGFALPGTWTDMYFARCENHVISLCMLRA